MKVSWNCILHILVYKSNYVKKTNYFKNFEQKNFFYSMVRFIYQSVQNKILSHFHNKSCPSKLIRENFFKLFFSIELSKLLNRAGKSQTRGERQQQTQRMNKSLMGKKIKKFFSKIRFFSINFSKAYYMRWKKLTLVFDENTSFSFYGSSKFFRFGDFEHFFQNF